MCRSHESLFHPEAVDGSVMPCTEAVVITAAYATPIALHFNTSPRVSHNRDITITVEPWRATAGLQRCRRCAVKAGNYFLTTAHV
jgi:hypothetical protein